MLVLKIDLNSRKAHKYL